MNRYSPPWGRLLGAGALLIAALLAGCSRVSEPVAGSYRATLNMKGGELPFVLHIEPDQDPARGPVTVRADIGKTTYTASEVTLKDGQLSARWPQLGSMQVRFDRRQLHGDWHMGRDGQTTSLPLDATLNEAWRFSKQTSTDNVDVTGRWQLEAISADHFNAPLVIQLQQRFDQVDGSVTLPDGQSIAVLGQVHNDDVSLASLGEGRAVLLKGAINDRGELTGEFWVNTGTAQPWVARRLSSEASTGEDGLLRHVGLPWAVPTRE